MFPLNFHPAVRRASRKPTAPPIAGVEGGLVSASTGSSLISRSAVLPATEAGAHDGGSGSGSGSGSVSGNASGSHKRQHVGSDAPSGPDTFPPLHSASPFRAKDNLPATPDGVFRVVLVAAGSESAWHVPAIVASLTSDPAVHLQIVATPEALRFLHQGAVDAAVRQAWNMAGGEQHPWGVRVWTDSDEWKGWERPGDTVLHRELKHWADLVLVTPCSADMAAKIASGMSDNVALSLIRALPSSTPVMVCPAMNPDMYANHFTAAHLAALRDSLHFVFVGPQGVNTTHPEGPGALADWRDIVIAVQDMAALFHARRQQPAMQDEDGANTAEGREGQGDRMDEDEDMPVPEPGPESEIFRPIWHDAVPFNRDGTPARHPLLSVPGLPRQHSEIHRMAQTPVVDSADIRLDPIKYGAIDAWKALSNNKYWERRWWMM